MIKSIIKIALLLVVGILGYNYFLGTEAEKEGAKKVVREVKDVSKSLVDLLRSERDKMRDGKYDGAFDKISDAFQNLKDKVKSGSAYVEQLGELEKEKDVLMEKFKASKDKGGVGAAERKALKPKVKKLVKDIEAIKKEIEKENGER